MNRAMEQRSRQVIFFNDTAPTEIYPLSLHDALPIKPGRRAQCPRRSGAAGSPRHGRHATIVPMGELLLYVVVALTVAAIAFGDRKSKRLNSSHANISHAVFCLKKNNKLQDDCLFSI